MRKQGCRSADEYSESGEVPFERDRRKGNELALRRRMAGSVGVDEWHDLLAAASSADVVAGHDERVLKLVRIVGTMVLKVECVVGREETEGGCWSCFE